MNLRPALLFLTIAGLVATSRAASAEDAPLRVMSFNIRYGTAPDGENHWDKRKEFVAETIRAFDPDLLGTQETIGFQRDFLAGKLTDYGSFGVGREDGGDKGEMMAVFYRKERFEKVDGGHFWLSETPDVVGSKSWDSSLPRMCTWLKLKDRKAGGRELWFFNTHFDHRGPESRREAAKLVRKKLAEIAGGGPYVLTGDFNAGEGTPPYEALFGRAAGADAAQPVDVYRAVHPEQGPTERTFSNFEAGAKEGARIDWIACSPNFQVESAEVDYTSRDGRTPSDHFPIIAVLQYSDAK